VRGLLLDFGGVLTTNVFEAFRAYCRAEGLPENALKDLFRTRPEALALLRRLETGELDAAGFTAGFAPLLGVEPTEDFVDRIFAGLQPDERMRAAVRAARAAGVRTGVVSNSWGPTIYGAADLDGLVDDVVISGEVGLHKPQPEIYDLAASRLGVPAAGCVFVDDLRENCAGAEAVGMTAVLHRGPDTTIPRLEELLGVRL
jgi:epoxide hydrolase-like predicted phosphatase